MGSFINLVCFMVLCGGFVVATPFQEFRFNLSTLRKVDEVILKHFTAFSTCLTDIVVSEGENATAEFLEQDDYYSHLYVFDYSDCFWECMLRNMDLMSEGVLEYSGPAENQIYEDLYNFCFLKVSDKNLETCTMAREFYICEFNTFLEEAVVVILQIYDKLIHIAKDTDSVIEKLAIKILYLISILNK